ncbi:hypothetical protein, partial [Marinobacter nauticus]|uniref:hypothetical protein n=1 Tax=Marinobacter nauticus TaxID=2743 RepID=UPI00241EB808
QSSQDPVNGDFYSASGTTRHLQGKTNLAPVYTIYFIYMALLLYFCEITMTVAKRLLLPFRKLTGPIQKTRS